MIDISSLSTSEKRQLVYGYEKSKHSTFRKRGLFYLHLKSMYAPLGPHDYGRLVWAPFKMEHVDMIERVVDELTKLLPGMGISIPTQKKRKKFKPKDPIVVIRD